MEQNLSFLSTSTIEEFKADHMGLPIRVLRNPHTSKLFFTCGKITGAVSSKGIPQKPLISLVETPEGTQFHLLHEEGSGGAEVLATF